MGRVLVAGDVVLDYLDQPPHKPCTNYGGAGRVARAAADVSRTRLLWPYGRGYMLRQQAALNFVRRRAQLGPSLLTHWPLVPRGQLAPPRPAQRVYGATPAYRTPADYVHGDDFADKLPPPLYDVLCLVDHQQSGDICDAVYKRASPHLNHVVLSTRRPQRYASMLLRSNCIMQWAVDAEPVEPPLHEQLLRATTNGSALLVTRGAYGASYYSNGVRTALATGVPRDCAAQAKGAGDVVTGVLAGLLAAGEERVVAAQMAVYVASYTVTSPGRRRGVLPVDRATPLSPAAWRRLLWMARAVTATPDDATNATAVAGEPVIYVPGCFDRLHAGHRRLLSAAAVARTAKLSAERCAYVLAIPSDESIRAVKGADRPVDSFADRATAAVAALLDAPYWRWNDRVVVLPYAYGEDEAWLQQLDKRPALLIKGDDYLNKPIPGSAYCDHVHLVPRLPGVSTTEIIANGDGV